MEQINRGKEGLDVRQTLSEAEGHVRAANSAVATAIELHQQELTADQNNRAHDSARDTVTVPDGFENLVSEYFKAVADKSANRK